MTDEEIKRERSRQRRGNVGCVALLVIVALLVVFGGRDQRTSQRAQTRTPLAASSVVEAQQPTISVRSTGTTSQLATSTETGNSTPEGRTRPTATTVNRTEVPAATGATTAFTSALSSGATRVAQNPSEEMETATVTRVIDGDTIEVRIGEVGYRVRYIGIDTPERNENCFDEATDANEALVVGHVVLMTRDVSNTDRFGRLLRYVYVGDTFVNAELIRGGWAESFRYPPDTLHANEFDALETEARTDRRGCFGLDNQAEPSVLQPAGLLTNTSAAQPTVRPSATPTPGTRAMYVFSTQNVNARAQPFTSASIVTSLAPGTAVEVVDDVEGSAVNGNSRWYVVNINNQTVYVHSNLLSDTPQSIPPTRVPQQHPARPLPAQPNIQPTQAPAAPTNPPAPAAPAFTCDCSKTCPAMASCEEAYFQLNQCGCGRRDGDNDGVPCEEMCPGG